MIIASDPLLSSDIGFSVVAVMLLKVVLAFALLMISVMLVIWFERKVVADMHNRVGPSLAGPWGILQTLADGIKLFFKEDLLPARADRVVFRLAPYLSLVPAFLSFAIVPIGGDFTNGGDGTVSIFGHRTLLQVADPPVGILLFLALSSIAVYGVMLAGWSSGSKYPLLGSVRASAQMISYEAALGLSMATVFLSSGTLSTSGIVSGQATWNWNLVATGVIPFVIFVILLMVLFGRNFILMFIAIGAVEWLTMARIVRAQVMGLKNTEFVEAARALGYSDMRIIFVHLLPNMLGPIIVYASLTVPAVMMLEAVLSFLGLGVPPPMSSWGVLIKDGAEKIDVYPWLLIFPAIFFSLTLFSLNFIGDGLRDALDPKSSKD